MEHGTCSLRCNSQHVERHASLHNSAVRPQSLPFSCSLTHIKPSALCATLHDSADHSTSVRLLLATTAGWVAESHHSGLGRSVGSSGLDGPGFGGTGQTLAGHCTTRPKRQQMSRNCNASDVFRALPLSALSGSHSDDGDGRTARCSRSGVRGCAKCIRCQRPARAKDRPVL